MGNWDFHCPNCFSEKTDGKRQCPYCGYDEGESRSPAALPLRTILNNQYVVGRVLGSPGGFGITYLCWDIKLATCVAIKEFMPRDNAVRDRDQCSIVAHSGKDRDFFEYGLKAFLAEARTVAGFDHPNIVKVRYFFEQNHTAYLVMDYYKGVSLAEYVKQKGGRLPEKVALGITRFVLDGLRHVHDSGYLHRDVKPANIYLTGKGQVLLLDFGAARYAMGEHSRSLSVVVTPGFSPFEQYSTKGKQGPWTDIYASGATLYYMLTGNLPESAPDRVLSDTLAEPVQLLPDLPLGVNKGIMLALRVKASDRPQSIEELKNILTESPLSDPEDNIRKTEEKSDEREKREEEKKSAIPLWRREERIYTAVAKELETGGVDKGLWTRLFAECSGDERQIKILYIKQRVERLITAELNAAEKNADDEKAEAERIAAEKVTAEKVEAERITAVKALHVAEQAMGYNHPDVATCLNNLAELYIKQGQYAHAEPLYKRSLAIIKKVRGPDDLKMAKSLNNLAFLYMKQGQYVQARLLYNRSYAIIEKVLGPNHPNVLTIYENMAIIYRETGLEKAAKGLDKRAASIRAIKR
ncbi:MAG: serine/threonine-protein kinase [Deltaproteobacteria bacterium]